jgi:hypothetical protein
MTLTDAEADKINSIFAIVMNAWSGNRFSLEWMIEKRVVDGKVWKQFDNFGIQIELGSVSIRAGSPEEGIYTLTTEYIFVTNKKDVVKVERADDGPWWDVIRKSIPRLENDARAMAAQIPKLTREMLEPQERQRKEELQRAANAVKKDRSWW